MDLSNLWSFDFDSVFVPEIFISLIVILLIIILCIVIYFRFKKLNEHPLETPKGFDLVVTIFVQFIDNLTTNTMGARNRNYGGLMLTLAMYIFLAFTIGLTGFSSPITYLGVPLSLALVTFVLIHYTAAKELLTQKYENKMQKTLDGLVKEYSTIRAGRANPHILDKITVDYYGSPTPLQQVANIMVPEARMIQIQPWESSLIKEIQKAILASDLGLNPNNDGKVIRLVLPELTEERRKELVKDVKKKGEAAKVAVRNVRRDANDSFKKLAKQDVSEDEIKELEDKIQKSTDKYVKEIDKAVEEKSKEIMTV